MKVIELGKMGFCGGVEIAISKLNNLVEKYPFLYYTHKIIHNNEVNKQYDKTLIKYQDDHKYPLIINAHGLEINHPGYEGEYFDLTCPKIIKIVKIINKYIDNDYDVVFFGNEEHQESKFISSLNQKITITTNAVILSKRTLITCQTTIDGGLFNAFCDRMKTINSDIAIKVVSNVCNEVADRVNSIIKDESGIFLIIGDMESSNSRLLLNTSKNKGNVSYLIEKPSDIDNLIGEINRFKICYLISATSASSKTIEEIKHKLEII